MVSIFKGPIIKIKKCTEVKTLLSNYLVCLVHNVLVCELCDIKINFMQCKPCMLEFCSRDNSSQQLNTPTCHIIRAVQSPTKYNETKPFPPEQFHFAGRGSSTQIPCALPAYSLDEY